MDSEIKKGTLVRCLDYENQIGEVVELDFAQVPTVLTIKCQDGRTHITTTDEVEVLE